MKESPIFLKSFETLEWILNHTSKFPKPQRFVMAKRIEEAALAFHDILYTATNCACVVLHATAMNRRATAAAPHKWGFKPDSSGAVV